MSFEVVLALIGILLGTGGLVALLKTKSERVKLEAEADSIREGARQLATKADFQRLLDLNDALSKRISAQDDKIAAQSKRIDELEAENTKLCLILTKHGINPECAV